MRTLHDLLDSQFSVIYARVGSDYRARFTPVLQSLLQEAPLSVAQIAARTGTTQPAATQTLNLMLAAGWVTLRNDPADARRRLYSPSSKALGALPRLQQVWADATQVERDLDIQLSSPISSLLDEAIAALRQRSFAQGHRDIALRSKMPSPLD